MPTNRPPSDRLDGYVPSANDPRLDAPPPPPRGRINLGRFDAELSDAIQQGAIRTDGFLNPLTGIGDPSRDKSLGGSMGGLPYLVRFLAGTECEDRWRGSDLGGRIVETVPDEMLREGWELSVQLTDKEDAPEEDGDDAGQAIVEEINTVLRDLAVSAVLRDALCYERAYGGGAVLLGVDDGETDLSKPLDPNRVQAINHLTAFRGGWDGELIAGSYYADPRKARFGEPETYLLRNLGVPISQMPIAGAMPTRMGTTPADAGFAGQIYVHESRLLVFGGTAVSRRARVQMRGWGDSIFTRVDEVLSQYGQTWGGIANLMTDWAQGVLKMDGLAELLGSNDTESNGVVAKRMIAIQMSRSIARTMLIDKTEDFSREVTSLAGVADVAQQFALRLSAAADMPVTLLMGQAPAGLNATGASDVRFFYDRIAARQRDRLLPRLHRLVHLLFLSKNGPTKGSEPDRWNIEMRSLWQPTDLEEAQLRAAQAKTDQIYLATSVVTPEEIAASRFGGSKWSMETVLDFEARKAMAALPPEPATPSPLAPVPGSSTPGAPPAQGAPGNAGAEGSTAGATKPPAAVARAPAPARGDADDQPRVPAGSPDGGQFASSEGGGAGPLPSRPPTIVSGRTSSGRVYTGPSEKQSEMLMRLKSRDAAIDKHLSKHTELTPLDHREVAEAFRVAAGKEPDHFKKTALEKLAEAHDEVASGHRTMPEPTAKRAAASERSPLPDNFPHPTDMKAPNLGGISIDRSAPGFAAYTANEHVALALAAHGAVSINQRGLGVQKVEAGAMSRPDHNAEYDWAEKKITLAPYIAEDLGNAIHTGIGTPKGMNAVRILTHEAMHATSTHEAAKGYEGIPEGQTKGSPNARLQEAVTEILGQHHASVFAEHLGIQPDAVAAGQYRQAIFKAKNDGDRVTVTRVRSTSYPDDVERFGQIAAHVAGLDKGGLPADLHRAAVVLAESVKNTDGAKDRFLALARPIAERHAAAAGVDLASPEHNGGVRKVAEFLSQHMANEWGSKQTMGDLHTTTEARYNIGVTRTRRGQDISY